MEGKNIDSSNNNLEIPKYMIINNMKYAFKTNLANEKYSYRCYHRKYKVILTIDKNNIKKLIENQEGNDNIEIQYKLNNKEHTCPNIIKTENVNNIKTELHSIDLAKQLINNSLEKGLNWHLSNLKDNGIILTKVNVKNYYKN